MFSLLESSGYPNYTIQADVIDINADTPRSSDIFLVDSNVWFWLTYQTASHSAAKYQLSDYPNYVKKSLTVGSKICSSGLSLAELGHRIEKTEYDIYSKINVSEIQTKEYRHNLPAERSRIVSQVEAAWGQVKTLAQPLDLTIDDPTTDAALLRFKTKKLDGYDLFILESMKTCGVVQIITDDGDFSTVPGIQVFTANRNVINAARIQRKLLSR
jgi:predicted nucleic acid-binding protein